MGKLRTIIQKHYFFILIIIFIALINIFIKAKYVGFAPSYDTTQYIETAKYLAGNGGEVTPSRILKPLSLLFMGGLAKFTNGDFYSALIIEVIIFYLFLALTIYYFLFLFFEDKKIALFGCILYITSYSMLKYGVDLYTETGANFFFVLSLIFIFFFQKEPSNKNFLIAMASILVGLLWKEYSMPAALFLFIVIFFHPKLSKTEKIKKLSIGILSLFLFLVTVQLIVFLNYHYSYLDWYKLGTDTSKSTDNTFPHIIKSLFAVYLLGWVLVAYGLKFWQSLSSDQKYFIKCLVLPSFMFLLWGGISSRLYYVSAVLWTLLAMHGLSKINNRFKLQVAIIAVIISFNFYWLFVSDFVRKLLF